MSEIALSKIAQALGLNADADESGVINALSNLRERAEENRETDALLTSVAKALDVDEVESTKLLAAIDSIRPAGNTVTLSNRKYEELQTLAQKGTEAAAAIVRLADLEFEMAFGKALDEGRVSPVSREDLRNLYGREPQTVLTFLSKLPKMVSTTARGSTGDAGDAPEGVDPESYHRNQRIRTVMLERRVPYLQALEIVADEEGQS